MPPETQKTQPDSTGSKQPPPRPQSQAGPQASPQRPGPGPMPKDHPLAEEVRRKITEESAKAIAALPKRPPKEPDTARSG